MIPGVIESEITKIPLITHCVFGRHRPAYIRLMCGRFTSRLMWPTTSVPGSDQRKRPEMFVLIVFRWSLSLETEPSHVVDGGQPRHCAGVHAPHSLLIPLRETTADHPVE